MSANYVNVVSPVLDAVFVLLLFCFNVKFWRPKILNALSMMHIMVFVGCIAETGAFLVDGNPNLIWANYLFNIVFLGSLGAIAASLFDYINHVFPKSVWEKPYQRLIILSPILIEQLMLFLAPFIGGIFIVTPEGYYQRSNLFIIQCVPYLYLLFVSLSGLYWYLRAETNREKKFYLLLMLFPFPTFILGGLQLILPANQVDLILFGILLSLFCNYALTMDTLITRDNMTGLFTRAALEAILLQEMESERKESSGRLALIMGDLDGFKKINDKYGHLEGDEALKITSRVLMEICSKYHCSAARFGGDEFLMIVPKEAGIGPGEIEQEICQRLEEEGKEKKYRISLSMGHAFFRPSDTVNDLVRAADRELYEQKMQNKKRTERI